MIPLIAFMIAIYGASRLVIATLDPHRRAGGGTMAQVAAALTWIITVGAVAALAVLALMVANSSASITS